MLKWSCASLLLIALLHNLYLFFQKTLTVPKIKDLVHKPVARYEELLATTKAPAMAQQPTDLKQMPSMAVSDVSPPALAQTMQLELSSFLKDLKTGGLF
jgi:hypothetical protein